MIHKKKRSKQKSISKNRYEGIVDMASSGHAFVIVKDLANDIMIFKQDLGGAFHKDFVSVEITKNGEKRMYGKIVSVVKRKNTEWVGLIEKIGKGFYFLPSAKYKIATPLLIDNLESIQQDQLHKKVIVKIAKEVPGKYPIMFLLGVWNTNNDDKFILNEILVEGGFHLDFPDEVLDYSHHFQIDIAQELPHRRDYRKIFTITIDPADAKDFDDALSVQYLSNGNIEVGVHIADVSHFVQTGTSIDQEAQERATSVYMPGFVLPMLPHNLSDNLCSLVPQKDRLTFSAIFELKVLADKIDLVTIDFAKTVIHSHHRYAYEDVQKIIETKEGQYAKEILDLYAISKILREGRMKHGAINFSSTEVKFELDSKNFPTAVLIKESKESHQLVEEFMLLANQKVAEFLGKQKAPIYFPYRVHDKPDEKKVAFFVDLVRKSGFVFDTSHKKSFAAAVNQLLLDSKQSDQFFVFEKLAIRSMAKAIYTTDNIGHYGLGFEYYTHFTSPIRRYPDILTHRALSEILQKTKRHRSKKEIEKLCVHCSTKEKNAVDAERISIKYKQTQYMSQFVGQEFDAIITGVASFGFWAETIQHKCEGMVKLSDLLLIDDFFFQQDDLCLIGKTTKMVLELGKKIKIKVVSAFIEDKELNYALVL